MTPILSNVLRVCCTADSPLCYSQYSALYDLYHKSQALSQQATSPSSAYPPSVQAREGALRHPSAAFEMFI